jgi:protein SCO1/2
MKTKLITAFLALFFCRSLPAGDSSIPSRASTLPPDDQPGACCSDKPAAAAKDACCEEIENPKSKIQNFSAGSLYQLDAAFTDDNGRPVTLGELRGRPVVLAMFFASCNYACPLTVTNMQAIRDQLPAGVRERTAFVLVSFDIARDTPAVLSQYRAQRTLDGSWTLLHGDDGAVRELAALLGVKYKQEASGMFSHSNIVTVLNPEGEIAYQRIGLNGGLDETVAAVTASAK